MRYDYKFYLDSDSEYLYSKRLLQHLKVDQLSKELKILDLGTGKGYIYSALKEWGFKNVHACDVVKCFKEVKVFNFEDKFKYPSNFFDIILAKDIIEHIRDNNNFMSEVHRILKPRGKAVIMTPNFEKVALWKFFATFNHYHPYTARSLRQGFDAYNFKDTKVIKLRAIPYIWRYTPLAFNLLWSDENNLIGVGTK